VDPTGLSQQAYRLIERDLDWASPFQAYGLVGVVDDITDDEIKHLGAIVVMYEGYKPEQSEWERQGDWRQKPADDKEDKWSYYNPQFPTVEPGDYFSESYQNPDRILTGEPMIRLLRQNGEWPRKWGPEQAKNRKELLIKWVIQDHGVSPQQAIEKIDSLSPKEFEDAFFVYQKDKL
jgi:hypothetical protein